MQKCQANFRRIWKMAQLGLIIFCVVIYIADVIVGNGDGYIDQLSINPLGLFFWGQLFLWLILGAASSVPWISNISFLLGTLIVGLVSINFVMYKLPSFDTLGHQYIIQLEGGYPFTSYDSVYFKNYRPNVSFKKKHFELDGGELIDIYVNKEGIRGPLPEKKAKGEHRILLIGDSFMQALQIKKKETLGDQLSTLLPDSVSVIQHGFASWSPLLEFNWLLRKGMSFEPDEVMIFLFNNDFYSEYGGGGDEFYTPYARFDENNYPSSFYFEKSLAEEKSLKGRFLTDFQNTKLLKVVSMALRSSFSKSKLPSNQVAEKLSCSAQEFDSALSKQNFETEPFSAYSWDVIAIHRDTSIWNERTHNRVNLSLGYLKSMSQYLKSKNIEFTINLIPSAYQYEGENSDSEYTEYFNGILLPNTGLSQKLNSFCQQQQIPFLNLYNSFKTYKQKSSEELLYFNIDGHWNAKGHRLAAETVADYWFSKEK